MQTGKGGCDKSENASENFASFPSPETHQQIKRDNLIRGQPTQESNKKRFIVTEPAHCEKRFISKDKLEQLSEGPKHGSWQENSQVTHDIEEGISQVIKRNEKVFKSQSLPQSKYVLKGTLEYDPCLMAPDESFPHSFSEDQVFISIVYPSCEFQAANNEFKTRHESMQKEADEHYRLLVDL